jgi:hypothetical protein
VAIVTAMPDPTLTPELALRYLDELSTDIRAAVLIDPSGELAAASPGAPGEKLRERTLRLVSQADDAAPFDHGVTQIEATTVGGSVFAVRSEGWTIAVVTGRFALPSLMFYDLRSVLGDLGVRAA